MNETVPLSTYRLQFSASFTFDDAARVVPYLERLGITHLYASPFLKARAGSTHGYDIVDHNAFNPELGGEAAFLRMSDALRKHGLGLILDFVPNHMGIGKADNPWWLDVLEWGPSSPHAAWFDIDWKALPHRRQPGVLLPILGKPYGDALRDGELVLKYDAEEGSFAVWYFGHKLPINPPRYGEILRQVVQAGDAAACATGAALLELAARHGGPSAPGYRDAPAFKHALAAVPGAADVIVRGLSAFRADDESGVVALHHLLERQHYRVAYWRVAFSAINYRRFFDVNDLAGLRMEHAVTFRATHALIGRLIAEGRLQGLRLDHIDGLRDPFQYARRLRRLARRLGRDSFYVVVEKILEEHETLPSFPGVAGTTGYEWLNRVTRLLLEGAGLDALDVLWRSIANETRPFHAMLDRAKSRVLDSMLASEFTVLTQRLSRIAAGHFSTRDYMLDRLRAALHLYVREFPVYRTYIRADAPAPADRDLIVATIRRARKRWLGPDPDIFDFLRDCITMDVAKGRGSSAARVREFAMQLQQFTGPLMAKALEDTAFYRYFRLLALNEVGGAPDAGPLAVDAFHEAMQRRVHEAPFGLTATATHDTKRGEDARLRILILAEIAPAWAVAVKRWRAMNAGYATRDAGRRLPSDAHEYMLYQSLLGSWPMDGVDANYVARIVAYACKAAREGKQETSWTNPDSHYEEALERFVRAMLDSRNAAFLGAFGTFAERVAHAAVYAGLSQLTLKTMMPGVPDIYQGTELWDLSLVDPDNRRAVDFDVRAGLLEREGEWPALLRDWRSGAVKLHLLRRLLQLRQDNPDLFRSGGYEPLAIENGDGRALAFARVQGGRRVVVIVARRFMAAREDDESQPRWCGHVLLPGDVAYRDVLHTGMTYPPQCTVALSVLLETLPVAVLAAIPADAGADIGARATLAASAARFRLRRPS